MLHLDSLTHRCSACSGLQEVLFGIVPATRKLRVAKRAACFRGAPGRSRTRMGRIQTSNAAESSS